MLVLLTYSIMDQCSLNANEMVYVVMFLEIVNGFIKKLNALFFFHYDFTIHIKLNKNGVVIFFH